MSEQSIALSRRAFIGGSAILVASSCLATFNPYTAFATPTAAEKQAEAAAALDSLNAMTEKLGRAEADYFTALSEQEAAQQKMDEAQARIDEANGEISDLQGQLGTRARSMYRTGSLSFLDLLLGATSFQAFTSNWDLLNDMNQKDADMVEQTKTLRLEVQQKRDEYAQQEQVAAEQAQQAAEVKSEAESLVAQMQATYDSLSAEAAELLEQERAARAAAEAAAALQAIQNNQVGNGGATGNSNGGNSDGGSNTNNDGGSSDTDSGNSDSDQPSAPTPAPSPEPSYNASTGNAVVDRAYSWVGRAEYVWGACSPGAFDCSGFVSYCLTGAYSRLGTTYTFMGWPQVSNPQPGDVCVNSGHCGIYIGGGQMIHAATYGVGVIVGGVQAGMIYVRY